MITNYNTVIIKGEKINLDNSRIVIGDIVEIRTGEKIPADMRIITSSGFKVDNSSLTGESDGVLKGVKCTSDDPMETQNLVFLSSFVLEGKLWAY